MNFFAILFVRSTLDDCNPCRQPYSTLRRIDQLQVRSTIYQQTNARIFIRDTDSILTICNSLVDLGRRIKHDAIQVLHKFFDERPCVLIIFAEEFP